MENYNLGADEVVLYKGYVNLQSVQSEVQLILTNINLVFISKHQLAGTNEIVTSVDTYPVSDVKIYQGNPQVKTKGNLVEIYFIGREIEFTFSSRIEQHKFVREIIKLITGKNFAERSAEKIKYAGHLIKDTAEDEGVKFVGDAAKKISLKAVTSKIGFLGKSKDKKQN